MTNRDLAAALDTAQGIERQARAQWKATDGEDLAERDAALVTVRKAAELVTMLERWMVVRAVRAARAPHPV